MMPDPTRDHARCVDCGAPATRKDPDGEYWCETCWRAALKEDP